MPLLTEAITEAIPLRRARTTAFRAWCVGLFLRLVHVNDGFDFDVVQERGRDFAIRAMFSGKKSNISLLLHLPHLPPVSTSSSLCVVDKHVAQREVVPIGLHLPRQQLFEPCNDSNKQSRCRRREVCSRLRRRGSVVQLRRSRAREGSQDGIEGSHESMGALQGVV